MIYSPSNSKIFLSLVLNKKITDVKIIKNNFRTETYEYVFYLQDIDKHIRFGIKFNTDDNFCKISPVLSANILFEKPELQELTQEIVNPIGDPFEDIDYKNNIIGESFVSFRVLGKPYGISEDTDFIFSEKNISLDISGVNQMGKDYLFFNLIFSGYIRKNKIDISLICN